MTIGSLHFRIDHPYVYVLWLLVAAIGIRIFMTFLRTCELRYPPEPANQEERERFRVLQGQFRLLWWEDFSSRGHSPRVKDFWHPFILGVFELIICPPLIFLTQLEPIGFWITFKTVAQWGEWKTNRGSFNRFVIGNACVLLAAICLAKMVHPS